MFFIGRGIRATAHIPKNEFICCYSGNVLTNEQLKDRERQLDNADSDKSYLFHLQARGTWLGLDATQEDGSLGRLINHSRMNPNCQMKLAWLVNPDRYPGSADEQPHAYFVSTRDISQGEELRWDYGETRSSKLVSHPWLNN